MLEALVVTVADVAVPDQTPLVPGGLEHALAAHVAGITYADLPPSTVDMTRRLILDDLGVALAGTRAAGCAELSALVSSWDEEPQARLFDTGNQVPAHNAILVNSTFARAHEFADVHEQGLAHSTATMVPLVMAVADMIDRPVSGSEFMAAVAVGIDVIARIGLAPRVLEGANSRPMSHTYNGATMVGALVAGKLLGFDVDALHNTLGIAYSQCAGNQQALQEGFLMVRVQQGISASAGLVSALLHQIGITGARESLEGVSGYYHAFHRGEYDRGPVLADLGRRFEVDRVSIKPYPCCKLTHTGIAAAVEATRQHDFSFDDIDYVEVTVNNHSSFDVVCEPRGRAERKTRALAGAGAIVAAQFSMPYVVATALVRGTVTLEDFRPSHVAYLLVLSVMDRVVTTIDENDHTSSTTFPTPGIVDVHLRGRRTDPWSSPLRQGSSERTDGLRRRCRPEIPRRCGLRGRPVFTDGPRPTHRAGRQPGGTHRHHTADGHHHQPRLSLCGQVSSAGTPTARSIPLRLVHYVDQRLTCDEPAGIGQQHPPTLTLHIGADSSHMRGDQQPGGVPGRMCDRQWLFGHHIDGCAARPSGVQRLHQVVDVHHTAAADIDEDGRWFHLREFCCGEQSQRRR